MASVSDPLWSFYRLEADADLPMSLDPRTLVQPVFDTASATCQDVFESLRADNSDVGQDAGQLQPFAMSHSNAPFLPFLEDLDWGSALEQRPGSRVIQDVSNDVSGIPPLHHYVELGSPREDLALPDPSQVNTTEQGPSQVSSDISISAPDTACPETDSEESWNEDEHSGRNAKFFHRIRDQIRNVASTPGACVITDRLPSRLRKIVHLLAHVEQCSHMSIGSGKERRVLVASDCFWSALAFRVDASSGKRWNCSKSGSFIDPTIVKIKNIPADLSQAAFEQLLTSKNVPAPRIRAYKQSVGDGFLECNTCVALADFEEAEDVATFAEAFQSRRLRSSDFLELVIEFVPIPCYTDSRTAAEPVQTTGMDCLESNAHIPSRGVEDPFIPGEQRRAPSRRSSYGHSGYSSAADSAGSGRRSIFTEYDSESSAKKKRKRHPMIPSGYVCHFPGCDKVFDYSGERAKHERVHMPKDQRPYACDYCILRFLDAKDLRRHEATHTEALCHAAKEGAVAES